MKISEFRKKSQPDFPPVSCVVSNARSIQDLRKARIRFSFLLLTIAGLMIGSIFLKYPLIINPKTSELVSLFTGFAPLIGLLFLWIIITFLFSLLIDSVDEMLADDDTPVPNHSEKAISYFRSYLFSKIAHSLSLKEHSPPVSPAICY